MGGAAHVQKGLDSFLCFPIRVGNLANAWHAPAYYVGARELCCGCVLAHGALHCVGLTAAELGRTQLGRTASKHLKTNPSNFPVMLKVHFVRSYSDTRQR